ncbi:MAG: hypothetical protein COB62_04555 [Piscirickettsiaceae bacterium]|nr:MAG: hypothetical protein COB62_04555 [Piscirickettsiaceae bacterium]
MIEETATVQSIIGQQITIHTIKQNACGGCKESASCSTSVLAKYFGNKEIELVLTSKLPIKVGDSIVVGLEERALLRLTLFIYLLPIIVMFAFALLGGYLQQMLHINNELITIVLALSGLAGSFFCLKHFSGYWFNAQKLNPRVLKIN